jgi:hypothetical protein
MNWNPIINSVLAGLWVTLGALQEDLPEVLADLGPVVLGVVALVLRYAIGWLAKRLGKEVPVDTPVPTSG